MKGEAKVFAKLAGGGLFVAIPLVLGEYVALVCCGELDGVVVGVLSPLLSFVL